MLRALNNNQYRQYGRSETIDLDFILEKITVSQNDEYPGIFSASSSALSSDLLYACKFSPFPGCEHILALANEDGKIALQNTNVVGNSRPIHGFQAHANAVFDLCWAPSSWSIVTGSGDQTSILLDIGTSSVTPVATFRGHSASIKSVDFSPSHNSVFASGSRDGNIMIWDVRDSSSNSKAENIIRNAHAIQATTEAKTPRSKKKATPKGGAVNNSITAVLFQNDNTLLSAGDCDGSIRVWDLRKNYTLYKGDPIPRTIIPYSGLSSRSSITSLSLNPSKTLLYAASMDSVIYEFNVSSYSEIPVSVYGGHEQHTFYSKSCLSGNGKYLISGSSDDHAYIWKIGQGPQPFLKLEGHGAEVTCVAWSSTDITKVVTCADDVRHRIWRLNNHASDDEESKQKIRARALVLNDNAPKSCVEVLNHLKKRSLRVASCKTPSSLAKARSFTPHHTPDMSRESPNCSTISPRTVLSVLSPLKTNVTTNQTSNGSSRASRRLEMDQTKFSSPTRNLPNLVLDTDAHSSPSQKKQSGTKRKELDWLTDHIGRKSLINSQNKLRRIK